MSCPDYHKQAYFYALNVLSLIEMPLMAFVIYCVVVHSHRSQKHFKWLLVSQLTSIAAVQLSVNDGTAPVFYLPATGIVFNGPVNYFLSAPVQILILFGMAGALVALSVALFEFRHAVVVPRSSRFDLSVRTRKIVFLVRLVMASSLGVPFWTFASNQTDAIAEWVQKIPCVLTGIDEHSSALFYTTNDFVVCVYGALSMLIPIALELVFYIWHSFTLLKEKNSKHLSERTKKLQKDFLRVLLFQEIAPLAISYPLPAIYAISSIIAGFMIMDLNNFAVLLLTSHGIFAGTSVLFANKPYWNFLLSLLSRCKLLQPNVVESHKPSQSNERATSFIREII